jgi:hypothetical protein
MGVEPDRAQLVPARRDGRCEGPCGDQDVPVRRRTLHKRERSCGTRAEPVASASDGNGHDDAGGNGQEKPTGNGKDTPKRSTTRQRLAAMLEQREPVEVEAK